MKTFSLQIRVKFKDGILDPQAEAIQTALKRLDFKGLRSARMDKLFAIEIEAADESQAANLGKEMANKLLANVVMENFEVEVLK